MHLSYKPNLFVDIFLHYSNLNKIFKILKKNVNLIALVVSEFFTPKNVVT